MIGLLFSYAELEELKPLLPERLFARCKAYIPIEKFVMKPSDWKRNPDLTPFRESAPELKK